jgi:hypothetical protein
MTALTWRPALPWENPGQCLPEAADHQAAADRALANLLDLRCRAGRLIGELEGLKSWLLRDQPHQPARGTVGHLDVTDQWMRAQP